MTLYLWIQKILELSDILIWPVTVIVSLILLKPLVKLIIDKIEYLKLSNAELKFQAPPPPALNVTKVELAKDNSHKKEYNLDQLKGTYKQYADILNQSLSNVANDSDKINRLITELTIQTLHNNFLEIYGAIYSSQINLLLRLTDADQHRISEHEAISSYNMGIGLNPTLYQNLQFNTWLSYLLNTNLINQDGQTLILTDTGAEFLAWIKSSGRSFTTKYA